MESGGGDEGSKVVSCEGRRYGKKIREEVKAGEALHVRAERLSKFSVEGSSHASVEFKFHFSLGWMIAQVGGTRGRLLISQWTTKRNRMQESPAYHVHRCLYGVVITVTKNKKNNKLMV